MKFFGVVLAIMLASAAAMPKAVSITPAVMRPRSAEKVAAPALESALQIRGGSFVTKELFIQTMSIANMGFGAQFFLVPKMFWEMNFASECTESMQFISRIAGIAILGGNLAFYMGDAEALYPVAMASCLLIAIFGPLRAEMTLPCKAAHKLPCVLLPGLLAMGALAF
mmetsp:Transcript_33946/g.78399  ORF Transcript_33946/g.78399 Transcript_33946/m.78399 type:complete len:168 (+) Transcript_33946:93-596(+)|eukprot:CAMPEP_0182556286 /NCGR_PEP_ID=MMETSP1324-20130603/600_1 /TAXON_ID=236786 /ORGANISM="Florenciella sp., Strain RCC1587" /LENGTH=167 /DNA_ID=CAMNT_0024768153 /DNA_START=110 /DNA_END=613 /DNA_ORIENTATION=+